MVDQTQTNDHFQNVAFQPNAVNAITAQQMRDIYFSGFSQAGLWQNSLAGVDRKTLLQHVWQPLKFAWRDPTPNIPVENGSTGGLDATYTPVTDDARIVVTTVGAGLYLVGGSVALSTRATAANLSGTWEIALAEDPYGTPVFVKSVQRTIQEFEYGTNEVENEHIEFFHLYRTPDPVPANYELGLMVRQISVASLLVDCGGALFAYRLGG